MTTEQRPGGSHRRVDRGRRLRVLLISLLVVVVVGGGVEAALHWRGESKRPSTNTASSSYVSPTATSSGATPPATAPAVSSSDAPTSSPPVTYPETSAPATPPVAATTTPAPTTASPAPSTSATSAATRPAVDILNSTHVGGMAARADATLTHGGWVVGVTGNYPKLLSTTTVFYPAGQQAAAQALAAQFTAIGKTAPAPSGVSTVDLTLVLAQDWTSSGK